jgi:hypothetical protein
MACSRDDRIAMQARSRYISAALLERMIVDTGFFFIPDMPVPAMVDSLISRKKIIYSWGIIFSFELILFDLSIPADLYLRVIGSQI